MYEKLIEMSKTDDQTSGNLGYCIIKNVVNSLKQIKYESREKKSRETNTSVLQQVIFAGKLEEDDGATMPLIPEKQQKVVLNFFQIH